jgi:DNA topoisomerase-1
MTDVIDQILEIPGDPVEAAKMAGLVYVNDSEPGIQRKRAGRGFRYLDAEGKPVRDEGTLERIHALGIPPAWTEVWICALPDGHIQATGRDAKGRKQYRYHQQWNVQRNESKFARMLAFGEALPTIREGVERDLSLPGLPREKVLATVVRLLDATHIRIGNVEYARANRSFGLTTMLDRHVTVSGSRIHFQFRGKSGKHHFIDLKDPRLAKIVKRCRDVPGQQLFQYLDADGKRHSIKSDDVNAYLRELSGQDFTAKDFRTWTGTLLALLAFRELGPSETKSAIKRAVSQTIKQVASELGNTPTVCRKYYIHPGIIDHYMEGTLFSGITDVGDAVEEVTGLQVDECLALALLRHWAET